MLPAMQSRYGDVLGLATTNPPAVASDEPDRESPRQIDAPLRFEPDWRWQVATKLVADTSRTDEEHWLLREADDWLSRVTDYIERMTARATVNDPVLHAAYDIRCGEQLDQFEIEARLLAGETPNEIAEIMTIPPEGIEAFERVFFAVRHPMGVPDAIQEEIELTRSRFGFAVYDVGPIWRLCGFIGIHLLDELLNAVPRDEVIQHGLSAYYRRTSSAPLSIRVAIALKCLHLCELTTEQKSLLCELSARAMAQSPQAGYDWMVDVLANGPVLSEAVVAARREIQNATSHKRRPLSRRRRRAKTTPPDYVNSNAAIFIRCGEVVAAHQRANQAILAEFAGSNSVSGQYW